MAIPTAPAAQPAPHMAHRPRKLTKPPKGRYDLGALLKAPGRLVHPGADIEKQLIEAQKSPRAGKEGAGDAYGGVTAGKVRGISRVKLCDVTLDDVVQGKLTPPLTLRDFEDYLAFREKSAENLYFYLWVQEYTKLYNQSKPSERSHQDVITLGRAFNTAVDTFFSVSSPLEVNVPSDIRREIDGRIRDVAQPSVAQPSNEAFLPPSAFDRVLHETSESLAVSFKAFRKQVVRNADRNRGYFAIFLGLLTWALGLIPTIVCTVLDKHRGYRAIGIFFWWFGITVAMGGFGKTCLVIYLFGDNRQLYPWELAKETDASTISTISGSDHWGGSTQADTEREAGSFHDEKTTPPHSPSTVTAPHTHTIDLPGQGGSPSSSSSPAHSPIFDLGYFPLAPASPSLSGKSGAQQSDSRRGSGSQRRSSTTPGGLYFAPAGMTLPASSATWAPFTKMLSPIVAREQRNLVLTAAGYGLLAAAATCAICLSVPNK
ncbi:hypothetical protein JCM6882_009106 [Rhodosporidiobolus microsporus]